MTGGIVITGLGTVGASGTGPEVLLADLAAGKPPVSALDKTGQRLAGRVPDCDLASLLSPRAARRMSRPSRFATAAALMSLRSAGLAVAGPDASLGLAWSSNFGPLSYTQRLLDQILDEGPESASPSVFTECVVNAPASQVSIATGASGPTTTLSGREAGPLLAVAKGCTDVAEGRVETSIVGTCEEATPLQFDVLSRLGALAPVEAGFLPQARPFDRRRNGFLLAEGASALVIESESRAAGRGASPLARIRGWGAAFDSTASRVGWGRGATILASALREMLARFEVPLSAVGLVVSGASGARQGDLLEAAVLRAAWDSRPLPPVAAPKRVTGEYGGGFLAAAVLASSCTIAAPFDFEIDPELEIAPASVSPPVHGCILVTSLASGGASAWLVLEGA